MPNSAIAAGLADLILPADLMAAEIISYAREGKRVAKLSNLSEKEEEELVNEIIAVINDNTEHDFSYYKRQTITRRITKRMAYLSILNLKDYLTYLINTENEVLVLRKEFLIGVTRFFRDAPAFDLLKKRVIPELVNSKKEKDQLKFWVVACSTGEEAYSLAIIVREYLLENNLDMEVKIFATDVDADAVEYAAKGKYPTAIESDVSRERLENFFVENGSGYVVNQHIRKMVVFAQHNIIKDPPFSKLDLVSCRNLLIYMKPVLQRKVLSTFHFSLNLGGYLFLGSSENANDLSNVLIDVSKKWNIFKTIKESENFIFDSSLMPHADGKNSPARQLGIRPSRNTLQNKLHEVFCETVVEELSLAAIYIDEEYNLIQANGNYKRFLELPDHKLQLNLLKLVRAGSVCRVKRSLKKGVKRKCQNCFQESKNKEWRNGSISRLNCQTLFVS